MGAGGFHGRVREGIGCRHPAMATRSSNPSLLGPRVWVWQVLVVVVCCGWVEDDFCAWRTLISAIRQNSRIDGYRADRAIRTGQLRALPRFHTQPINVMVYHGPRGDLV